MSFDPSAAPFNFSWNQFSDLNREFVYEAGGVAIDISAYQDILFVFWDCETLQEVGRFTLVGNEIIIVDGPNGVFKFNVTTATLQTFTANTYKQNLYFINGGGVKLPGWSGDFNLEFGIT